MRTRQEIDAEYAVLVQKYGDYKFKIEFLTEDLAVMKDRLTQLAKEVAGSPVPEELAGKVSGIREALMEDAAKEDSVE